MYVKGIKKALKYVRPLATGHLYYQDRKIINGLSSLIVLNKKGDLLTCAHNADLLLIADETNEVFKPIMKEIESNPKKVKKIEKKYGINNDTLIGMYNILIDIANKPGKLTIIKHPYLDLAIIKIENNKDLLTSSFPNFINGKAEIGSSVCKVGFAFPEYDTFYYNKDEGGLNANYKFMNFPIFPYEGMITRNVADQKNNITMFEISTPVLPGQAGGAVIDKNGDILGMMIGTNTINIKNKDYNYNLELGVAINSQTIIEFLKENNIEYGEVKDE
jgi:hypothetical protein